MVLVRNLKKVSYQYRRQHKLVWSLKHLTRSVQKDKKDRPSHQGFHPKCLVLQKKKRNEFIQTFYVFIRFDSSEKFRKWYYTLRQEVLDPRHEECSTKKKKKGKLVSVKKIL